MKIKYGMDDIAVGLQIKHHAIEVKVVQDNGDTVYFKTVEGDNFYGLYTKNEILAYLNNDPDCVVYTPSLRSMLHRFAIETLEQNKPLLKEAGYENSVPHPRTEVEKLMFAAGQTSLALFLIGATFPKPEK